MDRSEASALADLQMHWDEAYIIGLNGDIWTARYCTSTDELRAHTSTELRELIRSDYTYRQQVDLAPDDPHGDEEDQVEVEVEVEVAGGWPIRMPRVGAPPGVGLSDLIISSTLGLC
jgi:hypothetical protein